jgi:hypothetical protein
MLVVQKPVASGDHTKRLDLRNDALGSAHAVADECANKDFGAGDTRGQPRPRVDTINGSKWVQNTVLRAGLYAIDLRNYCITL